jgi:hypothetical protein
VTTADEYRLLGFTAADRDDAEKLAVDPAEVGAFASELRRVLGTFQDDLTMPADPLVSLAGFLATVQDVRAFHRSRGISDEISWATLADLGRQLDVHRRTQGEFGLETHWWVTTAWTGVIYQLGRLQFLLHQPTNEIPGVAKGAWILGVHIPETGPLTPESIDDSFAQAKAFFTEHFPDKPVRVANLDSWLIDPYLLDNLPQESNMVRFGRRFTPYGVPRDGGDSAVFFTFRSRNLDHLDRFPRDTSLQRLILDRIAAGGTWQNATGYLVL